MESDGGGWLLVLADTGRNEIYGLPREYPTLQRRGRIELPKDLPDGSRVKFDVYHPNAPRYSAIHDAEDGADVLLERFHDHLRERPEQNSGIAFPDTRDLNFKGRNKPKVKFGEDNECRIREREWFAIHGVVPATYKHNWIFMHKHGYDNGVILGTSSNYNHICDTRNNFSECGCKYNHRDRKQSIRKKISTVTLNSNLMLFLSNLKPMVVGIATVT